MSERCLVFQNLSGLYYTELPISAMVELLTTHHHRSQSTLSERDLDRFTAEFHRAELSDVMYQQRLLRLRAAVGLFLSMVTLVGLVTWGPEYLGDEVLSAVMKLNLGWLLVTCFGLVLAEAECKNLDLEVKSFTVAASVQHSRSDELLPPAGQTSPPD